jgi:hypothetical protein
MRSPTSVFRGPKKIFTERHRGRANTNAHPHAEFRVSANKIFTTEDTEGTGEEQMQSLSFELKTS